MKLVQALSLPVLLLSAVPAMAGSVSERTTYFMVQGTTLDELNRSFGRGGPLLGSGERHGGKTAVTFTPAFDYAERQGGCAVIDASVRLNVVTTLPKWSPPAGATREMTILWRTMRDEIATHESRHAAIAKTWQARMEKEVRSLPPRATCADMKRAADTTFRGDLAEHDRAQRNFDRVESSVANTRVKRRIDKNLGQFVLR